MVQVIAKYDGKVLIPDEPLDVPAGTVLRLTMPDAEGPAGGGPPSLLLCIDPTTGKRRLGQQRGAVIEMGADFDDPLGDDFWLGGGASHHDGEVP